MATKKKMLQAAAGQAGGAGLDITEVFSTYLYEGTGSAQTITNGIDLAGEGGLTWLKMRDTSSYTARQYHFLYDTERGSGKRLSTNLTDAEAAFEAQELNSFNSNGFSLGSSFRINEPSKNYASWTFRKAPKFFDVVQWDGDGVYGRNIPHSLDSPVGSIFIKCTTSAFDWRVWHRSLAQGADDGQMLVLNSTAAQVAAQVYAASSTNFTLTNNATVNGSGRSYVAYLFAHNDGDGEFGPDGDQDIIKCGAATNVNGSGDVFYDLGWEPQWLLWKQVNSTRDWYIFDNMRGVATGGADAELRPSKDDSESAGLDQIDFNATGFTVRPDMTGLAVDGSSDFIYIAIRRGPLAPPESATEVFAMDTLGATTPNPPSYNAGFPVDLGIMKSKTSATDFWRVGARLTGEKRLRTDNTDAEATDTQHKFDYQDGWYDAGSYVDSQYQSWLWKRAPSFFDVVAYTGTGSARTVSHNLGVAPEMMWVKERSQAENWRVYHKDVGTDAGLTLNLTNGEIASTTFWNNTAPTDTVFSVNSNSTNESGQTYISYLFASLPGISKVGSYTGDGTNDGSKVIDCGFSSGARFVLIKRTDSASDWFVFDSERGIVANADDPALRINTTNAEDLANYVEPNSSGFALKAPLNQSGGSYIFYAIA